MVSGDGMSSGIASKLGIRQRDPPRAPLTPYLVDMQIVGCTEKKRTRVVAFRLVWLARCEQPQEGFLCQVGRVVRADTSTAERVHDLLRVPHE
jgi:hypothetical protein